MAKLKQGNEEGYVTVAILPSTRKKLRAIQETMGIGVVSQPPLWQVVEALADERLAREGAKKRQISAIVKIAIDSPCQTG